MLRLIALAAGFIGLLVPAPASHGEAVPLWEGGSVKCSVVLPQDDERAAALVQATLGRHVREFFGVELPFQSAQPEPGLRLVAGTPENNPLIGSLVREGLRLTTEDLGDEGFQLISHGDGKVRHLVLHGRTPRALKHACQELVFFRTRATARDAQLEWPLNVVRRPEVGYRGIYMLPCWSQHDSIESWERVLRFNSELTLNRVWFWLDGFPVAGHPATSNVPGKPSDYGKTPLADDRNVQHLIDLSNAEAMKFYIGGGWMSWHHEQVVGKDPVKARGFYQDYLRHFKGVSGFYFEPTGEGSEVKDWRPEAESLRETILYFLKERPDFEIAIAIGKFNNAGYLKLLSGLDPRRVYWWWCWGDPKVDNPFAYHPSVLAWHTTVRMSDIHGTTSAPGPEELRLAGIATSYDPGMGFGNPWNGGSTLGGAAGPRNFHPYTMPYFSHEYRFRERCWNTRMSEADFSARLSARLFDADLPEESVGLYLKLADFCFNPAAADTATLARVEEFVKRYERHGTPRNRDTLARMAEAISGLRQWKAKSG